MSPELQKIITLAKKAGEILKKHFQTELDVKYKKNRFDPVTVADKEADQFLRKAIAGAFPGDEILSEEHEARPSSYNGRVWMVDPLDGTKAFIDGNPGFSVIIGLLGNHQPKLGVVYAPITEELFYAEQGKGSFSVINGHTIKNRVTAIKTVSNARLLTRYRVKGDIRPLDSEVDTLPFKEFILANSIGIKLSRIASGQADAFIHPAKNASKWDTLGGQVILTEAGGVVSDIEGKALDYEKPTVEWDNYIVAASTKELIGDIVKKL